MRGIKGIISISVLTAVLAAAVSAVPVVADGGYEERLTGAYPPEPNPCTGEDFVLFYDVIYLVHAHGNNWVATALPHKSSLQTSDGYVWVGGSETIAFMGGSRVVNPGSALLRHPDGSVLKLFQMLNLNSSGELVVGFYEWRCLRPSG